MKKRSIHMSFLLAIALLLSMLLYNMPVFAAGFEVEIGLAKGCAGETVTIPVSFKNVPAAGVNSCDFVLSYDTGVLEVAEDGITAGPVTRNASETFDFIIDADNGAVKFLYSDETGTGGEAIKSDGVFADIKFIIKQNATVGFSEIKTKGEWAFGNTGLEYIETKIKNGKVEVAKKQGYIVSGYVIPDFSFGNQAAAVLKSGFNVEIAGTETSTVTDQNGFFELNAPEAMTDCTLKIKKSGFLSRDIKNIGFNNTAGCTELSNKEAPIKMWVGDINNDGAINMTDIMELSSAFNASKGDSRYKSDYDINKDGAVNMTDIMAAVQHFNKVSGDYK